VRAPSPTLCFVDSELRTTRLRNLERRSADVQQQMSFLETSRPTGAAPVWATLDEQQRAEVAATLARLIAKVAAPRSVAPAVDRGENENE
jgi:hypothetical protein